MIGRTTELDELARVARSVTADGAAVVIAGEAGIGKTRVVEEFSELARADGFRQLRCTGLESEGHAGFAGLHELLHPVLDEAEGLPERQRQALFTAFGMADGPAPEGLLIGLAVLGLLEEVAARQRLLLVVEDVQWLDPSTAEVIRFLARRLSAAPILLLATVRAAAGDAEPAKSLPGTHLTLGPLSEADSALLLDSVASDLTPARRARILQEAGGNPLALREIPVALRERGPAPDSPLPPLLPTTRRLEQAFLAQTAALPAASRRLLLLAAAGGEPTLSDLVAAARQVGLGPEGLDPLERSGLVEVWQGRVRFSHGLLRSAVYGAASSIERADAHHVLAAVAQDPMRAAWHRAAAAGARDENIAAELEAAGMGAAQRGALAEAVNALERAAALSPEAAPRARRLAAVAELARQAGRTNDALGAVQQARPLATQPAVLVELAGTEIVNNLMSGLPSPSERGLVALARRLAGPAGDDHRAERIRLLWATAVQLALRPGGQHNAAEVMAELTKAGPNLRDPLQLIGLALLDPLGYASQARPRLETLLPPVLTEPRVLLSLGLAAETVQDLPTALAAFAAGRTHLQRSDALGDESHLLAWLACQRVLAGSLYEGVADAAMAERVATELGLPAVAAAAAASGALGLAWRGERTEAVAALARIGEQSPDALWTSTTARAAWASGHLALQQRSYRDAWLELRKVSADRTTALWALGDFTEAAVRSGKAESARRVLDGAERDAAWLKSPDLDMLVQRCRGLLAADIKAGAHFEAALEHGRGGRAVLERARTQLSYGRWLRRERRAPDARDHLSAALYAFEEHGAEEWANQAAAELRAAGVPTGRRPRAGRPGAGVLTPQELQIARLAADGLTNKEIADRIYLSHRTVGAHLYKIFPKLGITNRAQLREVMAALGVPEGRA
ncbi:AAA family ATPase [Amycolatopsis sp. A133]|uniref:helix-turn-helix transcriptional regulator n=1 Tax=Amycolatopsis sp. A133 TaxID=3064472 RepID=UPI0027FA5AC7|nr:AAA family ATPase [Amycolatopsis sp. A133]MDQ7809785.1 AAA family ATPase [Amycolatopsis sp. A133]